MILNVKTILILLASLLFAGLFALMIVLFFKTKSKPCIECGTVNKKGKICSKCGNPIITKKCKIFLMIGFCSILLSLLTLTFLIKDQSIISVNQSNERDYSVAQLMVDTEYINIRETKSVNADILGKVYYEEIYTIISHDDNSTFDWYEIETSTGLRGFIAGKSNGVSYVKLLETSGIVDKEEIEDNIDDDVVIEKTEEDKPVNKPTTKPNNNGTQNNKPSTNQPDPVPPIEEGITPPIDTTPEDSTSEPNPPVQEPEIIQPEKRTIAATKEYYCESFSYDYSASTKTCSKEVYTTDESVRKLVCPTGYEPGTGTLCEDKTERETVIDPTETITCSTGISNLYYIGGQYGCRTGYLAPDYKCPTGYKLTYTSVGSATFRHCVWNQASTVRGYYTCTDGYKLDSRNLCYKKITKDADVKYSCPEGYTLQGDMCYEN